VDDHLYALDDIVEKPSVEEAPSNIGAIGRYVFTPEIFDCIEQTSKGVDGELQLTDGIRLLNDSQKVYAHQFTGQRYDSGNKVEYVKAVLDFALKDEGMRDEILGHLEKLG
jgi:UTP--glucose-1-phosphate uridylyltransferase